MSNRAQSVRELIEQITSSERMRSSSHFSQNVYRSEPILTTGRQMASYMPGQYRPARKLSRWQEGEPRGRWLTEAEFFYRQGKLMESFEDDCPYPGTFKAYYPTYSAMSDRQLRGYITWRTAVRRGDIRETSLSFAYVYLYELLNGIGVANPEDGFRKLGAFWQAYREFAPEIDRYVRTWLRDYVVYHGLDTSLLGDDPTIAFDRALCKLVRQSAPFDPDLLESIDELVTDDAPAEITIGPRAPLGRGKQSALPLPAEVELEEELLSAADALSTYRIRLSRLYKDYPDDLRHVFCSVYVRLLAYYRRSRSNGLVETMFGEQANMSYTMFSSAVFFEPTPHPPADIRLDPIHWYRCRKGSWSCIRVYGTGGKSSLMGKIMRETDRRLRDALGHPHPLKERAVPKYLASMIDREIEAWLIWKQAHAPRKVEIDLSQLAGIRSAAAVTREALLTDEERGQDVAERTSAETLPQDGAMPAEDDEPPASDRLNPDTEPADEAMRPAAVISTAEAPERACFTAAAASPAAAAYASAPAQNESFSGSPLSPVQAAYLQALLNGDKDVEAEAARRAELSEDMLVDAINEALFDLLGDTVIEFGPAGPQVIEDYEDDIKEVLA